MKVYNFAWPLLATLGLAACAASGPAPAPDLGLRYAPSPYGETCLPFVGVAAEIAAARTDFNAAIAEADLPAIRAVLAEDTILITGTDSTVFSGRQAQLEIWRDDFADADRLVYARAPHCITVSAIAPIALERGFWRGAATGDALNSVGGAYSAKWRQIDGQWLIEAETYATTSCTGTLCPADTSGPAQ